MHHWKWVNFISLHYFDFAQLRTLVVATTCRLCCGKLRHPKEGRHKVPEIHPCTTQFTVRTTQQQQQQQQRTFNMRCSSPVSSSFSRAATGHQPLHRLVLNRFSVGILPSVLSILRVHFLGSFAGFGIRFRSIVIEPEHKRHWTFRHVTHRRRSSVNFRGARHFVRKICMKN